MSFLTHYVKRYIRQWCLGSIFTRLAWHDGNDAWGPYLRGWHDGRWPSCGAERARAAQTGAREAGRRKFRLMWIKHYLHCWFHNHMFTKSLGTNAAKQTSIRPSISSIRAFGRAKNHLFQSFAPVCSANWSEGSANWSERSRQEQVPTNVTLFALLIS